MTTDFQKLDCKQGCQLERMKFLNEQQFLDMNEMMNNLQTDHIDLCNILEFMVIPYLEYLAVSGDEEARDILIELNPFI
jgi:hypothetical protein